MIQNDRGNNDHWRQQNYHRGDEADKILRKSHCFQSSHVRQAQSRPSANRRIRASRRAWPVLALQAQSDVGTGITEKFCCGRTQGTFHARGAVPRRHVL